MKSIKIRFNWLITGIKQLKNKHFLDFPHGLLFAFIIASGIFLGGLSYLCFLHEDHVKIDENNQQIIALNQRIKKQATFIQSETNAYFQTGHVFANQTDSAELTSFVQQLSALSKKSHIEIQTIKPLDEDNDSKKKNMMHSLQIEVLGKYPDILNFLSSVQHFSMLTSIDTFQISPIDLEKNDPRNHVSHRLNLIAIISLYRNPKPTS